MRRLLHGVFAASFLLGMLTGCATTSSSSSWGGGCGSSGCGSAGCSTCGCGSGGCGSGGCGSGGCGSGGCGTGGCGSGGCSEHRLNLICHTAGVCDCDRDEDPCAHRAPWAAVRPVNYPLLAKAPPAAAPLAPVDNQPFGAAPVAPTFPAAPQAMPTSNSR